MSTWEDANSVAYREEVRAWCNTLDPFGPQFGFGDGDDDEDDDGGADDGPCDLAYECLLDCSSTDYDCAQACGPIHLQGSSATTFAALVDCSEAAGCAVADLDCLDSSCGAELDAFIET